jgi:cytochrome c oxidase assembly protein subunit 15
MSRSTDRLAAAALALVAATLGLMVLGALVRAHGAGLACPDWPLCFGRLVPAMDLRVAFEFGHRVVAGGVALAFIALAIAVWRQPATRSAAGRPVALAGLLLAVQILLGALTVWHLLAAWTVTSHLVTANLFAATLLVAALRLRDAGRPPRSSAPASPAVRVLLDAAALLLALQIALGGLVSSTYAGLACPEWPACAGGLWFPSTDGVVGLHLLHRSNAYLVVAALAAAAFAARGHAALAGRVGLALALAAAQVAVGIANVLLRLPVEVTGLHSALAAALVLATTASLYEARAR